MMRIAVIADTHSQERKLSLQPGDLLLHNGDIMTDGWRSSEIDNFIAWMKDQPYTHKVVIAGNHDHMLEKGMRSLADVEGIVYLENSGVELAGVKIWGSPVTPFFYNWAWNVQPHLIHETWDTIPSGLDILMTHGPAAGTLDSITPGSMPLGCYDLQLAIERTRPKVHTCGHIHGGHGIKRHPNGMISINASVIDERYVFRHQAYYLNRDEQGNFTEL
jgi:Icc-related predicted phosphoesterase